MAEALLEFTNKEFLKPHKTKITELAEKETDQETQELLIQLLSKIQ